MATLTTASSSTATGVAGLREALRPSTMLANAKAQLPRLVTIVLIRLLTVVVAYALVMVTIVSIIPNLGAYLHDVSGAASAELTETGTIALWTMPFAALTLMITVAEMSFLRWLWRKGSARIAAMQPSTVDAEVTTSRPAQRTKTRK